MKTLLYHAGLAISMLILTLACQQSPKKSPPVVPSISGDVPSASAGAQPVTPSSPELDLVPDDAPGGPLKARPLTASGDNTDGRFSPDGTRVIFVSRSRPTHKQAQIYELNVALSLEKRLTFHDGDDSGPVYGRDGASFYFASSTDENKEEPAVSTRMLKLYNPEGYAKRKSDDEAGDGTEIYEQSLNGRRIERLTRVLGFDGDVALIPSKSGNSFILSSARGREKGIHLFRIQGKAPVPLTGGPVIDRGASVSPDGKRWVWFRQALGASDNKASLMIGGNETEKPLLPGPGSSLHPVWHPSGEWIVFASNRSGSYNLYATDPSGTCLKRLTENDFDQLEPSLSPDGKQILFTSRTSGSLQVYLAEFRLPRTCLDPAAPVTGPSSGSRPRKEFVPRTDR